MSAKGLEVPPRLSLLVRSDRIYPFMDPLVGMTSHAEEKAA